VKLVRVTEYQYVTLMHFQVHEIKGQGHRDACRRRHTDHRLSVEYNMVVDVLHY